MRPTGPQRPARSARSRRRPTARLARSVPMQTRCPSLGHRSQRGEPRRGLRLRRYLRRRAKVGGMELPITQGRSGAGQGRASAWTRQMALSLARHRSLRRQPLGDGLVAGGARPRGKLERSRARFDDHLDRSPAGIPSSAAASSTSSPPPSSSPSASRRRGSPAAHALAHRRREGLISRAIPGNQRFTPSRSIAWRMRASS